MATIRVTPEELRSVASQFKASHDESTAMVQKLSGTIKNLDASWDGMASQRFYQHFEMWYKKMNEFTVLLDEINRSLLEVADRFEQADQQGATAPATGGPSPTQF
jgi:WXG100 family type VII secretion target